VRAAAPRDRLSAHDQASMGGRQGHARGACESELRPRSGWPRARRRTRSATAPLSRAPPAWSRATSRYRCSPTARTRRHLGERECSIQRAPPESSVEESPSPFVDPAMPRATRRRGVSHRRRRRATSTRHGRVPRRRRPELLLPRDEHAAAGRAPVTEMVTGIDSSASSSGSPAARPLGFVQGDVSLRGAAIECRINAEDPFGGWMPSPGTIIGLRAATGPWVSRRLRRLRGLHGAALLRHLARQADRGAPTARPPSSGWRAAGSPSTSGRDPHDDPGAGPRSWATTISAPALSTGFSTGCCRRSRPRGTAPGRSR